MIKKLKPGRALKYRTQEILRTMIFKLGCMKKL